MVATHYRWDFIGLSTDTKPTPETSEKVVDGSTFYCSDNSKLYVWCKNQWYEKEVSGGGGTTYTAGSGIDITDSTISVDTNTIQPKLTAGENITISDNVISASGGSAPIRFLTEDDFNYKFNATDYVAVWLLQDGVYIINPNVRTMVTTSGTFGYTSISQYASLICVTTQKDSVNRLVCVLGNGSGGYNSKLQIAYTIKISSDGSRVGSDFNAAITT